MCGYLRSKGRLIKQTSVQCNVHLTDESQRLEGHNGFSSTGKEEESACTQGKTRRHFQDDSTDSCLTPACLPLLAELGGETACWLIARSGKASGAQVAWGEAPASEMMIMM